MRRKNDESSVCNRPDIGSADGTKLCRFSHLIYQIFGPDQRSANYERDMGVNLRMPWHTLQQFAHQCPCHLGPLRPCPSPRTSQVTPDEDTQTPADTQMSRPNDNGRSYEAWSTVPRGVLVLCFVETPSNPPPRG